MRVMDYAHIDTSRTVKTTIAEIVDATIGVLLVLGICWEFYAMIYVFFIK